MYLYDMLNSLKWVLWLAALASVGLGLGRGLYCLDYGKPARGWLGLGFSGLALGATLFVAYPSERIIGYLTGVKMCYVRFGAEEVRDVPCVPKEGR